MIEVVAAGNAGMMSGLLDRMGQGGAARVRLYSGTRPAANASPSTPLIAEVYLAEPAGTINLSGQLVLAPGAQSSLILATPPTWARVLNGALEHLFDCDARVSTAANTGQELVVVAPAGLYAGALVQVLSGTFSALP